MIHGPRALLVAAALVACSGARPTVTAAVDEAPSPVADTDAPAAPSSPAVPSTEAPAAPAGPVQATALDAPTTTAAPRVRITAPRANLVLREDRVEVRLAVTGWPADNSLQALAVVDDGAPVRLPSPSRPAVFERLAQGTHVLRVWAATTGGARVLAEGAMATAVFHVGEAPRPPRVDARAPMLTCDAPDRTEHGSLEVQCAVSNAPGELHVRATLDGEELPALAVDTRYRLAPLSAGAHTLVLELIDANGAAVPGPLNRVERRVTAR